MGHLDRDTRVETVDRDAGLYRARLSADWDVWGPLGGYVVAVALRALGRASDLPRPASFHCAFLAPGAFDDVDVRVTTLRRGRRSEALRVDLVQGDRLVLSGTGWTVAEGLPGFEHASASMPEVPPPEDLAPFSELAENYEQWFPVWRTRTIDGRPVVWSEAPQPPVWHAWMRVVETPALDDPFLEAARTAMWLDLMMWNAATPPHLPWPVAYLAPNLDLSMTFHDAAPGEEWLLCDAHAPRAGAGLVGCTGRVWTRQGRLLASGVSTLFCRPNPEVAELAKVAGAARPEPA